MNVPKTDVIPKLENVSIKPFLVMITTNVPKILAILRKVVLTNKSNVTTTMIVLLTLAIQRKVVSTKKSTVMITTSVPKTNVSKESVFISQRKLSKEETNASLTLVTLRMDCKELQSTATTVIHAPLILVIKPPENVFTKERLVMMITNALLTLALLPENVNTSHVTVMMETCVPKILAIQRKVV
jgi:hypothetical protein